MTSATYGFRTAGRGLGPDVDATYVVTTVSGTLPSNMTTYIRVYAIGGGYTDHQITSPGTYAYNGRGAEIVIAPGYNANYDPGTIRSGTTTYRSFQDYQSGSVLSSVPVADDPIAIRYNPNFTLDAVGTEAADSLSGDAAANRMLGLGGDDFLNGSAGADRLDGGSGQDTANYLGSSAAVQVTIGGAITGGYAAGDVLIGIENVTGSQFADTIGGDAQGNVLDGRDDADRLAGNDGNDVLYGGTGNDTLDGGTGADRLEGGDGQDTADYRNSTAAVQVAIGGAVTGGYAAGDILVGIENVTGSQFADTIDGDAQDNLLDARDGADQLAGNAGNDILYGGAGNDTLDGGTGADRLEGGDGQDTADYRNSTAAVQVAIGGAVTGGYAAGDILVGIENVTGSQFADTIDGDAQGNLLDGREGADEIDGNDGNDILYGAAGNDDLDGGIGADRLDGGEGNDILRIDNSGDVVVELADGGIDLVRTRVDFTLGDHIENLTLIGPARVGTGNTLANRITGGNRADTLNGAGGNDVLIGGSGADTLSGGIGADTFRFADGDLGTTAGATDTITDFQHGDGDRINLAQIDGDTGTAANEPLRFIGTAAFSGTTGELRYEIAGGITIVSADTDGDSSADMFLRVNGAVAFVASDFVLGSGGSALLHGDSLSAFYGSSTYRYVGDPLMSLCLA